MAPFHSAHRALQHFAGDFSQTALRSLFFFFEALQHELIRLFFWLLPWLSVALIYELWKTIL